jgi:hypothetical protein
VREFVGCRPEKIRDCLCLASGSRRKSKSLDADDIRQAEVLETVLHAGGSVPVEDLLADAVAAMISVGLLREEDGMVGLTPAAVHYSEMLDATKTV